MENAVAEVGKRPVPREQQRKLTPEEREARNAEKQRAWNALSREEQQQRRAEKAARIKADLAAKEARRAAHAQREAARLAAIAMLTPEQIEARERERQQRRKEKEDRRRRGGVAEQWLERMRERVALMAFVRAAEATLPQDVYARLEEAARALMVGEAHDEALQEEGTLRMEDPSPPAR